MGEQGADAAALGFVRWDRDPHPAACPCGRWFHLGERGIAWVGLGRQRNWPCYGRIRSKISRSRQTLTRDAPSHPKPFLCRGNIRVSFLWTTQGMKFLDEVRSGAEAVRQHGWEKCQTACKPGSVRPVFGAGRPFLWDASHDTPHATNPGGGTGTSLRSLRFLTP